MPHSATQPSSDTRAIAAELELQAFSYMVSHDLAASFRHVSEFSRLLLGELGEGLTGRQQSHAEHIRAATDRCQSMMDQLLSFSRVQQQTLEPVSHDATLAMRQAMTRLNIPNGGAWAVSIEPLGEVFADGRLLGVMFQHLLDNALKFRRPDVPVRVHVEANHDLLSWRVRLTDNGVGVDPALRAKAFEMFRRLNSQTAYPGVGAGLAICRRIARRHGGELQFLDCDEGACIELTLPHAPTLQ
jgi:light-regulated signal transduction histidine kinase (bacteriophytochrome)